jgi:2-succinyl-5-enolpyruvyl-6-hydroxy-3-cyclohexene-1-carboxylate synthase
MTQPELIRASLRLIADLGVREACVAAGARNAPVIAALLESHDIKLWNFFEERSAAFFALGRVRATGRPVAVLTTSGTASAELLPAVIEAHYQALPLVAFTTDRPKTYRGSGAPQSIEQAYLFGCYAPTRWDLDFNSEIPSATAARLDSPVHLNLCLEEPLSTQVTGIDFAIPVLSRPIQAPAPQPDLTAFLSTARPAVLAAGLTAAEAAEATPFLRALQAPIFAEATSNFWHAPNPPPTELPSHLGRPPLTGLLWPASEAALAQVNPTHVLRLGSVPTSRWWRDLEDRPDIPVINLARAPFPGLARKENVSLHPWSALAYLPLTPCQAALPEPFQQRPFATFPHAEPVLLHALQSAFTTGSQVFLGNSLPIREFNDFPYFGPLGVTFHANRGANGIEGLISTWLGLSADASPSDSWLILGDLSALYDLAGPWVLSQLAPRRRFVVVVNNGGGKIFSRVPGLRALPETARALIENRHTLRFNPLADLWDMSHTLIYSPDAFSAFHALDFGLGTHLIELHPDPDQTEAFWAASP